MTAVQLGLLAFPVLLGLIFLRAPIGLAMLVVGVFGMWAVTGSPSIVLSKFKTETFSTFSSHSLSIIPIFPAERGLTRIGAFEMNRYPALV